jgi:hypothetical protein
MTDAYAQADALRVEAYGVLRLMRGCNLDEVRGQPERVWLLRYMVATHMMMQLAGTGTTHHDEGQAA